MTKQNGQPDSPPKEQASRPKPIVYLSGYCAGRLPATPAPVGGPVPDRTVTSPRSGLTIRAARGVRRGNVVTRMGEGWVYV